MAKAADADDLKQLGSDVGSEVGPLKKAVEDVTKSALLLVKSPNPKIAEKLAEQLEKLIDETNDLKKLLKELQAASK